jgi:hypothetical protein
LLLNSHAFKEFRSMNSLKLATAVSNDGNIWLMPSSGQPSLTSQKLVSLLML